MDQHDDIMKKKVEVLLRVMNIARYRDEKVPCQIEEGLFLGSIGVTFQKDVLKSSNISHILTVAQSITPAYPDEFVYKVIPVMDKQDTNLAQYFSECCDFIDEAKRQGGGVLVHCFAGISRSVTIVVAYLMKRRDMSFSQALKYVKTRRPMASPNSGFTLQLQDLERSIHGDRERSQDQILKVE